MSTHLSPDSDLSTSECCWRGEFVKMMTRNLQSLLVCSIILRKFSLTTDDLNFWLTVLSGISDHELVFDFHSSHVVMCVLIH